MDPLTHLVITYKIVSPKRSVVLAGLAADLPFYLTYPVWLLRRGQLATAIKNNEWPQAPKWMYIVHHLFHSFPVLLTVTLLIRLFRKRWPPEALAWALHIAIDLPTHSKEQWAPQFLWPLSTITVNGISWTESLHLITKVETPRKQQHYVQ